MKKMMILTMMVTIATHVAAMSYNEVKAEALFLTDKMAYELRLDNEQYEAVYEINFDYIAALDRHDIFGNSWSLRNSRLRYVLNSWQYDRYLQLTHFYRPVAWHAGSWVFGIYNRYNRSLYYRAHPSVYVSYRGGNNRRAVDFYAGRHLGHAGVGHVAHRAPQPGRHLGPAVKPAPRAHKPAPHAARPAAHGSHISVHVGW